MRKTLWHKGIAVLLSLLLCIGSVPVQAQDTPEVVAGVQNEGAAETEEPNKTDDQQSGVQAAEPTNGNNAGFFNVTGGTEGTDWKYIPKEESPVDAMEVVILKDGDYTITGNKEPVEARITVGKNVKGRVTLNNVNITRYIDYEYYYNNKKINALLVQDGAQIDLHLKGLNTLQLLPNWEANKSENLDSIGLCQGKNGSVNITGDESGGHLTTGYISTTGSYEGGNAEPVASSDLTMDSGTVVVRDSLEVGDDFDLTVNGGMFDMGYQEVRSHGMLNIEVNGGSFYSGSIYPKKLNLTVNGGFCKAEAEKGDPYGEDGIAIAAKESLKVTINGGEVNAIAKGIYSGISCQGGPETEPEVIINGGNVHARGGEYGGHGIGFMGGASSMEEEIPCGSNILITGGNVNAITWNSKASGIGGNNKGGSSIIKITGGTVTAQGGEESVGIGGGFDPTANKIIIDGGDVKATTDTQPVNVQGDPVYPARLGVPEGTESVTLKGDSDKVYTHDGSHFGFIDPDGDNDFYAYLPDGNHSLQAGDTHYGAVFKEDHFDVFDSLPVPAFNVDATETTLKAVVTSQKPDYAKVQYQWDNGAWGEAAELTGLEPASEHTLAVRYTYGYDGDWITGASAPQTVKTKGKAASQITITGTLDKTYDGNPVADPAYEVTGTTGKKTVSWQQNTGTAESPNWQPLESAPVDAGSYKVIVSAEADDNYHAAQAEKAFVIKQSDNQWEKELTIDNWTYGEPAKTPEASARFGQVKYMYSNAEDGAFTAEVPAGAGTWYVKASVAETTNFKGLEAVKSFEIRKADPAYTLPEGLTADVDQQLKDVALPEGFSWENGEQSVGEAGDNTFKATYTPADTANYNTITGIDVTVTVRDIVTVEIADMIVYTGSEDGYGGTVDENGNLQGDKGTLPEPGFRIRLSEAMNKTLHDEWGVPADQPLDLSGHVTFTSGDKTWQLERYGEGDSTLDGQYIYRIAAAPGQEPVRVQFTDKDGNVQISDDFDISQALYVEYTISVYPGAVDKNQVTVTIDGKTACGLREQSGTLSIRGLSEEREITPVVDTPPQEAVQDETAVAAEGTVFTINGSDVEVSDPSGISLLSDAITHTDVSEAAMEDKVNEVLFNGGSVPENYHYTYTYLDLVDTHNGNAWVTASQPLTIYLPYPEGTNQNTDFSLVHFEGLDRDMEVDNIVDSIAACDAKELAVETTPQGIRFSTQTFSPFALTWAEDTPSEEIPVESVSLDKSTAELTVGDSTQLTATVLPENATNKNVSWRSSADGIATVKDGKVTAVSAGKATITVTTADGSKTATCEVTVKDKTPEVIPVESVSLDKSTAELTVGDSTQLTATVLPENATNKNVSWRSSADGIATVKDGKVTAVSAGKATITVTTADGSKTATCEVTVNDKAVEPTPEPTPDPTTPPTDKPDSGDGSGQTDVSDNTATGIQGHHNALAIAAVLAVLAVITAGVYTRRKHNK